jgi:hypothetical protein
MDKPIAWYDPSNGMVSTDQDCPLFTPLGQVWPLYPKQEEKDEPVAWRAWVSKFPQGTGSDWVYVTKPIMKDSVHNQPLYTTPPQRTWLGLTADEMLECLKAVDAATAVSLLMSQYKMPPTFKVYAEAIEAKLKEKNYEG